MKYAHIYTLIALIVVIGLLTGCTVGPDFTSPAKPEVADYTATPLPVTYCQRSDNPGRSHSISPRQSRINPQWWQELGSARLDALVLGCTPGQPHPGASTGNLAPGTGTVRRTGRFKPLSSGCCQPRRTATAIQPQLIRPDR